MVLAQHCNHLIVGNNSNNKKSAANAAQTFKQSLIFPYLYRKLGIEMSKINFEEQHFNLNVKLYFTECYVSAHPASKSILPSFSSTVNVSASAYDILTDRYFSQSLMLQVHFQ